MPYTNTWVRGPVGLDADLRVTRRGCRTVLVMAPTVTAGSRLMDVIPLLEGDFRVQTVFTIPEHDETWHGTHEFLRATGGLVVPWHQAARHRWDLVLSASHRHVEQVRGKLLVLPHGAGAMMSRRYSRKAGGATRPTSGLDRELLTYRGRVIPAAIALTHDQELRALRRTCPEALPAAVVAGDICLDRMTASQPFRQLYRRELGVRDDQELVTISSTWTPDSTFGQHPGLYARLTAEAAGANVRVAAVLHPNIWAVHGAWQIRAWLAEAMRQGLLVVPPDEGWRATMIASDHVIGDHGSTTSYAAAIGRPTHLVAFPDHAIRPNSIAAILARTARRLEPDQPIIPQLRAEPPSRRQRRLAHVISSHPGQTAARLRTTMYDLLQLSEPPWPPAIAPVPLPRPMAWR